MTIGIDASRANKEFKTGTEWYSYYLIKNLVEIDRENKYILYSDKPLNKVFLNDLNLKEKSNVRVKVLKWPFKYLWTLGRLSLEMLFFPPKVLFVPAHSLPLINPKKTINTIHDIAFIENNNLYDQEVVTKRFSFSSKLIDWLIRAITFGKYRFRSIDHLNWSTKFALKNSSKIIAVSNFTKNEILKNYKKVNPDKIKVVHNGFFDHIYKVIDSNEGANVLSKYGIDSSFFLYVGRLEKKKNIHNLIEAFSIFKENNPDSQEKLVLIGSAGLGYDEMRYMIDELELENDILILGWVEELDLPYIFNKAKAFVFPSFYEGFGIPVIQAMACGTPVLASDIEVLHEVASEAALFFDPKNEEDMADKMRMISVDSDLRNDLKIKGIKRSKSFSWRKCAEETLKEINSI
jgi:glycosyltransferase involved in cell wall biosynthesis